METLPIVEETIPKVIEVIETDYTPLLSEILTAMQNTQDL